MADVAVESSVAVTATTKKGKGKSTSSQEKKPRMKPSHPKTSDMVNAAIKSLKERGGSSLQAIKKYISVNYKVDAEKMAPFIRKYLKTAVTSGSLVQTKGKGASGSFKLATAGVEKTVAKKPSKPTKAKKVSKPVVKSAPKKTAAKSSPSKAKKTTKAPTQKPKAPKPKKVTATKSKKAAPKKK